MLERFQPRIGDAHAAEWRMRLPVFTLTVPVRAPRDAESQPLGDAHQPLLDGGGVTGVADLDAIESLILKDAELCLGAMVAQMRGDGQSSHVVHQCGDLTEPRQRLLDIRRPATAQVPAERIADVVAGAAVDESARDVRPSQRPPVSAKELRLDVLELDRHAEALQLRDDLFAAAAAGGARIPQEFLQPLVVVRQKQGEHVQLTPGRAHAELAAGNDSDA